MIGSARLGGKLIGGGDFLQPIVPAHMHAIGQVKICDLTGRPIPNMFKTDSRTYIELLEERRQTWRCAGNRDGMFEP